ncbi:MAG TPA: rubrerythrin family protein [Verrucomicrobiae bacterium]|nr:rubrerythrin family protein [Verrucomicrobiae bacterium]
MKPTALIIIGAVLATITMAKAETPDQTVKNLNAAFQGESNAAHRYTLFATKAEQEGYAQVAKIFRAAARAESIHRDSHKQAILALDGKIDDFKLDQVTPGTTAENLRAAIKGETYERDTMYPEFLAQARKDNAKPAIRTLTYAHKAEAEHARLYQEALDNLGHNVESPIYVCKVCGYTTTRLPANSCPSCREPVSNYVSID